MADRTTKLLLAGILVGVWFHLFVSVGHLSKIESHLSMLEQWTLHGSPVTPTK